MKLSEVEFKLKLGDRVIIIEKAEGSIHSSGTLTKADDIEVIVVQRRDPITYYIQEGEEVFEIVKYR